MRRFATVLASLGFHTTLSRGLTTFIFPLSSSWCSSCLLLLPAVDSVLVASFSIPSVVDSNCGRRRSLDNDGIHSHSSMGRQSLMMMMSKSTTPLPSSPLPKENRGIYFGRYGHPAVERTTSSSSLEQNNPLLNLLRIPSTVLVQIYAVGLNPVDAKGVIGDKLSLNWTRVRKFMHNLFIKDTRVGFDFAGIVVADTTTDPMGDDGGRALLNNNCHFPPGTVVYGTMPPLQGSFAEYVRVPLHQVAKAPSNIISKTTGNNNNNDVDAANANSMTVEELSTLPLVGLTAWQALSPYIVPGKSSVLIVGGSGGTGHVAIQVAKALGARHIVTICSTRNIEFVKGCGATHVVDYSQSNNVIHDLYGLVVRDLGGECFDVILDCVTSGDPKDAQFNYPQRIRHAQPSIVTPNHLYQRLGGHWTDWIRAGLARPGIFPHSWLWKDPRERLFWIKFPHSASALEELTRLVETGKLKPRVEKIYLEMTVDSVQQAMDDVLSRRVQGKIALQVLPHDAR